MKQECLTYLKSIGKSKALAATLSDSELETNSNESDQEGIVSAFTATVESTEGEVEVVDEEEKLMESQFEKMDDQEHLIEQVSGMITLSSLVVHLLML